MKRLALLALLLTAAPALAQGERGRWDVRRLALIPTPGYPAHAYVHPQGRIYAGTYDNPSGDTLPSRVFELREDGALLRSWTVRGQDLTGPHGVQVATSARGRLVLLDKSPPRVLVLDRRTGRQTTYATFPAGTVPNYATWGPDGSLYVTDYGNPVLWRVPPRGGPAEEWLRSPMLDGADFGATGMQLMADRSTLIVAVMSGAGLGAGNPSAGRLLKVPIGADGKPGAPSVFWESGPLDSPDGFAIAQSGTVYVTLLLKNQLVAIKPDGSEQDRSPTAGYDAPSSAQFLGNRLIVAQQSYFAGNPDNQAILDVWAGEPGLRRFIPASAGPARRAPRRP